jgi:hypothetical protein
MAMFVRCCRKYRHRACVEADFTGSGARFVISASNNATRSGAFPKNPGRDPFTINKEGWYTFEHRFYSVPATPGGLELGTGVFIEPDGSASGVYSAVLTGKSLLGQPQQIKIEGSVLQGDVMPNGQTFFSGIATVNLGDATPTLSSVPFSVTIIDNTVRLSVLATNLPAAQVASGAISIE